MAAKRIGWLFSFAMLCNSLLTRYDQAVAWHMRVQRQCLPLLTCAAYITGTGWVSTRRIGLRLSRRTICLIAVMRMIEL